MLTVQRKIDYLNKILEYLNTDTNMIYCCLIIEYCLGNIFNKNTEIIDFLDWFKKQVFEAYKFDLKYSKKYPLVKWNIELKHILKYETNIKNQVTQPISWWIHEYSNSKSIEQAVQIRKDFINYLIKDLESKENNSNNNLKNKIKCIFKILMKKFKNSFK